MQSKKTTVLVAIAVLVAGVAAICQIYALGETSVATVLWSDREAYLILGIGREGNHTSYLSYPWVLFKNYLGGFWASEPTEDQRGRLISIRVTSSGFERHNVKVPDGPPGSGPSLITPLEGRIYANCPFLAGPPSRDFRGLCWLDGERFEPATPAERLRFDLSSLTDIEIDHGKRGAWRDNHFEEDPNVKADEGETMWSKRTFRTGSDSSEFTIEVGHEFKLAMNMSGSNSPGGGAISIGLLRLGHPPEGIWNFKARHAIVSRAEYRRAFQGSD